MKFLLDENISPKTAQFLRAQGFNAKSLIEEKIRRLTDEEVVRLAIKEKRTIITFDKDYSQIYYFLFNKKISVIVLNLLNQTVENVNNVLKCFIKKHRLTPKTNKFKNKLIILSEGEEIIIK